MNALFLILIFLIILQLSLSLRIVARNVIVSNRLEARGVELQSGSSEGSNAEYKKWSCRSCSYIYDESKGFKKRIPAGTKFDSMATFACPGTKKNYYHRYQ